MVLFDGWIDAINWRHAMSRRGAFVKLNSDTTNDSEKMEHLQVPSSLLMRETYLLVSEFDTRMIYNLHAVKQ